MYDLNSITPAQAVDPSMPVELMAQLAAVRPDLHRHLLQNPSLYPQLRQWILDSSGGTLGPQIHYSAETPSAPATSQHVPPEMLGAAMGSYVDPHAPHMQVPQPDPTQSTVPQSSPAPTGAPASEGVQVDWSWTQSANSGPLRDLEAFANGTRSRKSRGDGGGNRMILWAIAGAVALIAGIGAFIFLRGAF